MTTYRYVIQNEDGRFYWKGNGSSCNGLKEGFDNAYLFKNESSARQRMKLPLLKNSKVRKVEIKLLEE